MGGPTVARSTDTPTTAVLPKTHPLRSAPHSWPPAEASCGSARTPLLKSWQEPEGPWWPSQTFLLPFLQINKGVSSAGNACSGFCPPDQTMTRTTFEVRRRQTSQSIFIWTGTRKMYFILHSWGDDYPHFHTNWSLAFLYSSVYHIHIITCKQKCYLVLKSENKHTPAMEEERRCPRWAEAPGGGERSGPGARSDFRFSRRWQGPFWGTCKQNHEWVWETGPSTDWGVSQVLDMQQKPGQWEWLLCLLYSWAHGGLLPALGEKLKTPVSDVCVLSRA